MEKQQIVEKITRLQNDLDKVLTLEMNIRSTFAVAGYYSRKIAEYKENLF